MVFSYATLNAEAARHMGVCLVQAIHKLPLAARMAQEPFSVTEHSQHGHTWVHGGPPACGGVLPTCKQAIQAHDAEEKVVQVESLYAVTNCMRVCPQKVGGHGLERLKGVPVLLQSRSRFSHRVLCHY